jgi:hypothetical protein
MAGLYAKKLSVEPPTTTQVIPRTNMVPKHNIEKEIPPSGTGSAWLD